MSGGRKHDKDKHSMSRRKARTFKMPLDPAQQAEYVKLISEGVSAHDAAQILGFHPATIRRWLAIGREAAETGDHGEPDTLRYACTQFYKRVASAKSCYRAAHLRLINEHASKDRPGDWKASMSMLKHSDPRQFHDQYQLDKIVRDEIAALVKILFDLGSETFVGELAQMMNDHPILFVNIRPRDIAEGLFKASNDEPVR